MTANHISGYVFGPVVSGRLGRSLGVDMLGANVCTMDCIYCEVGRTTKLTLERREWAPARAILDELQKWRDARGQALDYVTLGGAGEPCLNSAFGAVVAGVREIMPGTPVAVLTNATLLTDPCVRAELSGVDVVLPSMDTLVEKEFRCLNRAHPDLDLQEVAAGLLQFREEFSGRIFMETLLIRGVNDSDENLALLKEYVHRLRPDRVDVVTMTRPGAYAEAMPVDEAALSRWRTALGQSSPRPGAMEPQEAVPGRETTPEMMTRLLFQSLLRRPQTAAQLATALELDPGLVKKELETLQKAGHIKCQGADANDPEEFFFRAVKTQTPRSRD